MCIKNSLKCTFAVLLCVGVFFCYGFKVETEEVLLPEINSELNVEMEENTETIEDVKVLDEDEKLEETENIEEKETEEVKDIEESEATEEEAKDVEEKEEATEKDTKDVEENEETEEEAKDIEESEATEETKDVEENKEQEFYIEDEETGIIIKAESGVIPFGAKILVNRLDKMKNNQGENYEEAMKNLDEDKEKNMEKAVFYSIDLVDDNNEEVQPNGNVEVMLPIPDDFDENDIKVFRVIEDKDIEYGKEIAVIRGVRYCSIKAEHFSIYCLYDRMRQHDYMEYVLPYTIATSVILLGIVGIALYNRKRNI